ncbi:MAG: EF-hand domain-containing protein [bacterium]|nr:EF-hand domain-containing protein [bacterium]
MNITQRSFDLTALSIPALTIVLSLGGGSSVFADGGGIYSPHDINHDGFLDQEEFKIFIEKRRIKQEYAHLWVFDEIDRDKDGKISQGEMSNRLNQEMQLRLKESQRKT